MLRVDELEEIFAQLIDQCEAWHNVRLLSRTCRDFVDALAIRRRRFVRIDHRTTDLQLLRDFSSPLFKRRCRIDVADYYRRIPVSENELIRRDLVLYAGHVALSISHMPTLADLENALELYQITILHIFQYGDTLHADVLLCIRDALSRLYDLSLCHVSIISLKPLSDKLNGRESSLRQLVLRECNLGTTEEPFLSALIRSMPHLERLDLTQNPLGNLAVVELSRAISDTCTRSLSTLLMAHTRICGIGMSALVCVAGTCHSLEDLDLAGNFVGDAGATQISETLLSLPKLKRLHLAGSSIGDSGAEALAQTICAHESLEGLDLYCNQGIGCDGALALARALSEHDDVHMHLILASCSVGAAGRLALEALDDRIFVALY